MGASKQTTSEKNSNINKTPLNSGPESITDSNVKQSLQELVEACERISRFPIVYLSIFDEDTIHVPASVRFPYKQIQLDQMPEEICLKSTRPDRKSVV